MAFYNSLDTPLVSTTTPQQKEGIPEKNTPHPDIDIPNTTATELVSIYWRHARRAKVLQPLRKYNSMPSQLLALGTFIAIFWVLWGLISLPMALTPKF